MRKVDTFQFEHDSQWSKKTIYNEIRLIEQIF